MNEAPLVSIICPTFNHGKFIAQALEGFVNQKTTFPFEIIVHDDASTDNTAAVVKEYEAKYPDLFSNIYQTENQFSKRVSNVSRMSFAAARGKYLALCEGDDYWSDPLKLQKQVDFLEANPQIVAHFHNARIIDDKGFVRIYNNFTEDKVFTQNELVKTLEIPTASVLFRNKVKELPEWLLDFFLDITLYFYLGGFGDFHGSKEIMSVYRMHDSGMWTGQMETATKISSHIGIRYKMLKFLPLSKDQKRIVKQMIVDARLQRMKVAANMGRYNKSFFSDLFNVLGDKMKGFNVKSKYFIFCILPDRFVFFTNRFRKEKLS